MVLKAYWPLDEESGSTAKDVRNSNDGTVNGATMGANGILGTTAYSLDGTDDYVAYPAGTTSYFTSADYTVCFWMKSSGGQSIIFSPHADADMWIRQDRNGNGHVTHHTNSDAQYKADSQTPVTDGNWHFVAAIGRSGQQEIWVDGVLEDSLSAPSPASKSATNTIGQVGTGSSYWRGVIADVRVYDHALTDQEVQYLYQVGERGLHVSDKRGL